MRIIIAGGRDFNNYAELAKTMDYLLSNITDDITIVCGKARGADTLGEQYVKEKGYAILYFPADWNKYGRSAGFIRNEQMAKNADALAAFWDGQSVGTRHMIETAKKNNLLVRIHRYKAKQNKGE